VIVYIISISHVIFRARVHMTCNDPTEALRLNKRAVTEGHCTVMPPVSRGTTGPATDRSEGEHRKLGKGGEAINASGQA